MSDEGNHHYVPCLLLKNWRVKKMEGKIKVWTRVSYDGRLQYKYRTPSQFGYKIGLYRLEGVDKHQSQCIEREIFANQIENRASPILTKLAARGAGELSDVERAWWAVFVNAFRVRHPVDIERFRAETEKAFQKITSDVQLQSGDARVSQEEIEEWFDSYMRSYRKNIHWHLGLPLLGSEKLLGQLLELSWFVFDVTRADCRLLLGDRPLVTSQYAPNRSPIFSLPITPTRLFVAGDVSAIRHLRAKHVRDLVIATNIDLLRQATRFVCGNADEQLLKLHFPRK